MGETGIGQVWKVGELAAKSGLTVRALHHYDRIGLVCPAGRTSSGHRLYSEADVGRLYQVLALRQLGLGLDQISQVLTGTVAMGPVLAAHRDYLAAQVAAMLDLHTLVAALAETAANRPDLSADHFLALIRRTVMVDDTAQQHFTRDNAEAFIALYFAQLTARQRALEFWYAKDAQLTVGDTAYVGTWAIFEQLFRFPPAEYNVNAIDVEADTDLSAILRATGKRVRDNDVEARPFEASFTLNRPSAHHAYLIADQTFTVV